MSKTLLLMRHAKSDWHNAMDDFHRPLNARGQSDLPKVASALKASGYLPDLVLSSTATRAEQTTTGICQALGIEQEKIEWLDKLYLADSGMILSCLQQRMEQIKTSILLVSHNPGLDELTRRLSISPPPFSQTGKLMTTAAVAVFEIESTRPLDQGHELKAILRPREL